MDATETSDLFPVATDREHLLASVFGQIPEFADPKKKDALLQTQEEPLSAEEERRVEACYCELYLDSVSFVSVQQRNGPLLSLIRSTAPGSTLPDGLQGTNNNEKTRKRRNRRRPIRIQERSLKKARKAERIVRLEDVKMQGMQEVKMEVDSRSAVTATTEGTVEIPRLLAEGCKTARVQVPPAACSIFATVFFSLPYDLEEVRKQMLAQFPSLPATERPQMKIEGDSNVSPLLSFPGVVRDMRLLYRVSDSAGPYSPTWENKIDMRWPLCEREIKTEMCSKRRCPAQHKRDYELTQEEKLQFSRSVGEVDRQRFMGQSTSFLHWPVRSADRSVRILRDDIPLYKRNQEAPIRESTAPLLATQSSLLRSVQLNLEDLRTRGIQLCMDYTAVDILKNFPSPQEISSSHPSQSPRESSELSDVVDILEAALGMIEGGQSLSLAARQAATKFLSKKLAIYPHERLLWQLYLALFMRDDTETCQSKLHQAQLCTSMCGPWYRAALMLAAVNPTPDSKILTLRETIQSITAQADPIFTPSRLSECCLDLVLRIVHVELSTTKGPFNRLGAFSMDSMSILTSIVDGRRPKKKTSPQRKDILDVLPVLSNDLDQAYIFALSMAHGAIHGKLPLEFVHALGFPKHLKIIAWPRKELNSEETQAVQTILSWATIEKEDDAGFFSSSAKSPGVIQAKQVFAANVLLLLQGCKVADAVKCVKNVFRDSVAILQTTNETPHVLLTAAKVLDAEIAVMSRSSKPQTNLGNGYILEQIIVSYLNTHQMALLEAWLKMEDLQISGMSPRVQLALSSFYLLNGDSEKFFVRDAPVPEIHYQTEDEEIPVEKSSSAADSAEKIIRHIHAFYNRIVRNEPIDVERFLRCAMDLAQDNGDLSERLWMEMLVLLSAALPKNDFNERPTSNTLQLSPVPNREIPFPVVREYLTLRKRAVSGLLAMIEVYIKNHVSHVDALDNVVDKTEDLPPMLKSVLDPPQLPVFSCLLDHLRIILPLLEEHEVMRLVELLCVMFPTSPQLAEFLIDAIVFVPSCSRSCLRYLVTQLLHSIPTAGFDVWVRAIDIGYEHGSSLGRELSSFAKHTYPDWKFRARL